LGKAAIDGVKAGSGFFIGTSGGEEGGAGGGAGGGEVAEGAGEGFAAGKSGWGGSEKMDALDDGVGFENEVEFFGGGGEDGAVVAEAVAKTGQPVGTEGLGPAFDPKILPGETGFHSVAARPSRSRVQVLVLKRAWTRMAGSRLPLAR
jgi:hypothetical protein